MTISILILLSTIIKFITNIYHYHYYHRIHHKHHIHHHCLSLSSFSHPYHEHHSSTIDHILLLQMNRLHVYIILFIGSNPWKPQQQRWYTITIYSTTNESNTMNFNTAPYITIRSSRSTNTRRGKMYTIIDTITIRKKRKTITDFYRYTRITFSITIRSSSIISSNSDILLLLLYIRNRGCLRPEILYKILCYFSVFII